MSNTTELVMILDKSGSMGGLESDTIGGFNAMIAKQKKVEGEVLVSTVLFATKSEVIYDRVPIDEVRDLTEKEYEVGGCTALIDAVADAIHHIGNIHKYARKEDVPEKTIFVITTDGEENASRRHSAEQVKEMVKRQQEKYGWEFIFLGANIDAVETAGLYGIPEDRAVTYNNDSKGIALNYQVVSETLCCMRSAPVGKKLSGEWKKEIEADHAARG